MGRWPRVSLLCRLGMVLPRTGRGERGSWGALVLVGSSRLMALILCWC